MGCVCTTCTSNRVHPLSAVPMHTATNADKTPAQQGLSRKISKHFVPAIRAPLRSDGNKATTVADRLNFESQVLPPQSPEHFWSLVDGVECQCSTFVRKKRSLRDRAWKTVHVFVASCSSGFDAEHAILASQVFPEISRWCESICMQFMPINFQWGLSKEVETAEYIITSLKEIERCSEDDMPVFFLALLSETLGWVPNADHIPQSLRDHYSWVPGTSLLEMEIIHAACKNNNPNAVFLFRDPSFLHGLPPEHLETYVNPEARDQLQLLKSKLRIKFPEQLFTYHCQVSSEDGSLKLEPSLSFQKIVTEFFINRIQKEFLLESGPKKQLSLQSDQQIQELERLCSPELIGKANIIEKVVSYVESSKSNSPLLLVGELGSGKSTIMAKCIQMYITKHKEQQLITKQQSNETVKSLMNVKEEQRDSFKRIPSAPRASRRGRRQNKELVQPITLQQDEDASSVESVTLQGTTTESPKIVEDDAIWHVFYHFICSFPRSAELRHILQRIWAIEHLGEPRISPMKTELNALANDINGVLSRRGRKRVILFIDGIDRIRDEHHFHVLKWIPAKLPDNIRIIVSLSPNGETRKALNTREPKCTEVHIGPLNLALSKQFVCQCLSNHGLIGKPELVKALCIKLGICTPQYIVEVCNELARAGSRDDTNLQDLAERIPGDLGGLYDHIIASLEDGTEGRLVIAALCLLECSRYGLQESEFLDMLGALTPSGFTTDLDDFSKAAVFQSSDQEITQQFTHAPTTGHDLLEVYGQTCVAPNTETRADSSLCTWSAYTSQSQLRSSTDFGECRDVEICGQQKVSIQSQEPQNNSLVHNLILPGTLELNTSDDSKLSPKSATRGKGSTYGPASPTVNELLINPLSVPSTSASPEGNPNARKPHKLPPSPSLSLLSAELAHTMRKTSSSSQPSQITTDTQVEAEIQELQPSTDHQHSSDHVFLRNKPTVGLERMNIVHGNSSALAPRLPAYSWAQLFYSLRPFLRSVGRSGESRWAIADKAFSMAVWKKYFKQPPTQTFPFSFCTSQTFYGADNDQNLYTLMSQKNAIVSSRPGSSVQISGDLVQKRCDWWHARLAGYFSICGNEDRRAEELPYHLARIQDHGRLSHSLVHLPTFERLSDPENVSDLLRFWKCAGGCHNAVNMYQHALDDLEISGASSQEMVSCMQKVAMFLHKAGETECAQQILVDAIDLEETHLGGRPESMAMLTLNITELLSQSSREQLQFVEPVQSLEVEYRLLQFASRSVKFHRGLQGVDTEHNLASLLMLLSIHLFHYASAGGSAALSSRNALEEAQETAQEAAEIYKKLDDSGRLLEVYLHLALTYTATPRRALEILEQAKRHCHAHFGDMNDVMPRILFNIALNKRQLSNSDSAEVYYKKWAELTALVWGEDHPSTTSAREYVANFLSRTVSSS